MQALRHRLRRFAGAVLTAHVSLLVAVPTMLYLDLRAAAAECMCPVGDGGACPMHHKMAAASGEPQPCAFQSAADSRGDAVLSLLGPVAVLTATFSVEHEMASAPVPLGAWHSLDHASVPDSPPPRG